MAKNIEIQINTGNNSYEVLYPKTSVENINGLKMQTISGSWKGDGTYNSTLDSNTPFRTLEVGFLPNYFIIAKGNTSSTNRDDYLTGNNLYYRNLSLYTSRDLINSESMTNISKVIYGSQSWLVLDLIPKSGKSYGFWTGFTSGSGSNLKYATNLLQIIFNETTVSLCVMYSFMVTSNNAWEKDEFMLSQSQLNHNKYYYWWLAGKLCL